MTNSTLEIPGIKNFRFGYFIALFTAIATIVTFVIGIFTPPISGSFCIGPCIEYPYLDIVNRYPRDYYWMFSGIIMVLLYVILMASVYYQAANDKKIYGLAGLAFSVIAASLLYSNYFIQLTVIQPSLLNGEKDGIPLLTQYNPHGIFIALEEAGYLLMSLSLVMVAPVFVKSGKTGKIITGIFITGFVLAIFFFIYLSFKYGVNRGYIYEVIIITIDYLLLLVGSLLIMTIFNKPYAHDNNRPG